MAVDRYQALTTEGRGLKEGKQKFLGVVDDWMHIPFRIGSDIDGG